MPLIIAGDEDDGIEATIEVHRIAADGDGWANPRAAAYWELNRVVRQNSGPRLQAQVLETWASAWVDGNQKVIQQELEQ
jgi:hypothetical protein